MEMEYDGLKLMRVDEKYDTSGGSIDAGDPWRTVEAATYGPGVVGNLLPKRVYTHTNNDATPDATNDFYYAYDHVGNVRVVFDADGEEAYHFNQDAFGNELAFENYTGDSWATARAAGVTEHQTGKWIDPFTGLYFFHARWYDSGAGRWFSREPLLSGHARNVCLNCDSDDFPFPGNLVDLSAVESPLVLNPYIFCLSSPIIGYDHDGRYVTIIIRGIGSILSKFLKRTWDKCKDIRCKNIERHSAHHQFKWIGKKCHFQLTCWKQGRHNKGSQFKIHIPVPDFLCPKDPRLPPQTPASLVQLGVFDE